MKASLALAAYLYTLTARAQDASSSSDISNLLMDTGDSSASVSAAVSGASGTPTASIPSFLDSAETTPARSFSLPLATGTASLSNSTFGLYGNTSNSSTSLGSAGSTDSMLGGMADLGTGGSSTTSSTSGGSSSGGGSSGSTATDLTSGSGSSDSMSGGSSGDSSLSGSAGNCADSRGLFTLHADYEPESVLVKRGSRLFTRQSSSSSLPYTSHSNIADLPAEGHSCGLHYVTLSKTNLTDQRNWTCEVTSNHQYQCDENGGQFNAITKNGFTVCGESGSRNMTLSVNGQNDWWFCRGRNPKDNTEFWNVYESKLQVAGVEGGVPKQCTKGKMRVVGCTMGGANSTSSASVPAATPMGGSGTSFPSIDSAGSFPATTPARNSSSSLSSSLLGSSSMGGSNSSLSGGLTSLGNDTSSSSLSSSLALDSAAASFGADSTLPSATDVASLPSATDSSSAGMMSSAADSSAITTINKRGAVTPWTEGENHEQEQQRQPRAVAKRSPFPLEGLNRASWRVRRI